jgi:hypothetical protein
MLIFDNKEIRAKVIRRHVISAGYKGVVCLSCGNASAALKKEELNVIDISPRGILLPNKWFTPAEIHELFPDHFDATSGHLPLWLMEKIGAAYRANLGDLDDFQEVPSGSGETIICLSLAYPKHTFIAVYNNNKPETEYSPDAPLNAVVRALCGVSQHYSQYE